MLSAGTLSVRYWKKNRLSTYPFAVNQFFSRGQDACTEFDRKTSVFQGEERRLQVCVPAPTLFAIYFAALLQHAFDGNEDGI